MRSSGVLSRSSFPATLATQQDQSSPNVGEMGNRNRLKHARQADSAIWDKQQRRTRLKACHVRAADEPDRRRGPSERWNKKTGFRPKGTQRLGIRPQTLWLAKRQKVPESPRKRVNAGWALCDVYRAVGWTNGGCPWTHVNEGNTWRSVVAGCQRRHPLVRQRAS